MTIAYNKHEVIVDIFCLDCLTTSDDLTDIYGIFQIRR